MTSVAFIMAETLSPSLRSSFSADSLVITAVTSPGSTFILTLAIIIPLSTFFIVPSNRFLALVLNLNHLKFL